MSSTAPSATAKLLPTLEQIASRHQELSELLGHRDAAKDMDRFTKMNREYAELTPVVEKYTAYAKMLSEKEDLEGILNDDTADADMKALAKEEVQELHDSIPKAEHALQVLLLPKDADDDKNVILEIRAGTGGDEAALFVGNLFGMYTRFAELKRWKVEVMEASETGIGGYKEVIAQIAGSGAYAAFKFERGTHRVQRVPETETQGRIHTSAVTVAVLPEVEEVDVNINPADLRIDTYRSQGAGGQHVNTTDSAVRITHIPTGVVAACQEEKSQHKNKAKAMKMLLARIMDAERIAQEQSRAASRKSQVGSGDRSERIRTYNYPQSRVTDHRINLTKHNLAEIIAGDGLEEVILALKQADQAEKLAALGEETV